MSGARMAIGCHRSRIPPRPLSPCGPSSPLSLPGVTAPHSRWGTARHLVPAVCLSVCLRLPEEPAAPMAEPMEGPRPQPRCGAFDVAVLRSRCGFGGLLPPDSSSSSSSYPLPPAPFALKFVYGDDRIPETALRACRDSGQTAHTTPLRDEAVVASFRVLRWRRAPWPLPLFPPCPAVPLWRRAAPSLCM